MNDLINDYPSKEEYNYAMYEAEIAMKILEDKKKQAKKECREVTWEDKMDVLFFGL